MPSDWPDWPLAVTPDAFELDCCDAFQEPGSDHSTTSQFTLDLDRLYGITAVHKEGSGGDWWAAAFRPVGDPTPASDLSPISPEFTFTSVSPAGTRAEITRQPNSVTAEENTSAQLSIDVSVLGVTPQFGVQWFVDRGTGTGWELIPGGVSTTYTTLPLSLGDEALYRARIYAASGVIDSDEAQVTVIPNTSACEPARTLDTGFTAIRAIEVTGGYLIAVGDSSIKVLDEFSGNLLTESALGELENPTAVSQGPTENHFIVTDTPPSGLAAEIKFFEFDATDGSLEEIVGDWLPRDSGASLGLVQNSPAPIDGFLIIDSGRNDYPLFDPLGEENGFLGSNSDELVSPTAFQGFREGYVALDKGGDGFVQIYPSLDSSNPMIIGHEHIPVEPLAVTVDGVGQVIIAEPTRVLTVGETGDIRNTFDPRPDPGLAIADVAVGDDGNLYVAFQTTGEIHEFTSGCLCSDGSGDVDCNGEVNMLDFITTQNTAFGRETLTAGERERADINGDGEINYLDLDLSIELNLSNP